MTKVNTITGNVTQENYWQQYHLTGQAAYKEHWKKHPIRNVSSIIWFFLLRAFVTVFFYVPGFLTIFLATGFALNEPSQMTEIINTILSELKATTDYSSIAFSYFSMVVFIYLLSIPVKPPQLPASFAEQEAQSAFLNKHSNVLIPVLNHHFTDTKKPEQSPVLD